MENIPENITTPPENKINPTKNKTGLLVGIIVILLVLLLLSAGYFSYKAGYLDALLGKEDKQEQGQEKEEEMEEKKEEEAKSSPFEGKTVSAILPEGYKLVEYYNGEGTDSLPEGNTYTGFTGLKIMYENMEIFSIRAVSGIGFIGCPMYPKFADFNPLHLEENENIADEMGDDINIVDYANTKYTQFEWLGKTFRRIGVNYFYDTAASNSYFEPPCFSGIVSFDGLNFTDSNDFTGEAYFFGASVNATEEDLLAVDKILESMKLIK